MTICSWIVAAALWGAAADGTAEPHLPRVPPAEAGLDEAKLREIDREVAEALQAKKLPGCVVVVGRRDRLVWRKAYGDRQVLPQREPMTADTVFDLASLTKPLATATSVMILADRGHIRLDDLAVRHLPEFGREGKQAITVLHLLTHQAGLTPDNSLNDYQDGPAKAWERICALQLVAPPGTKFIYSDVGYIVLGELVRRVSGKRLDQFAQDQIFTPLEMKETGFLPAEPLRRRAAPTERRDGQWIRGAVHDPRSHLLGGVAGHAGLFSTADDLAVYCRMMLSGGKLGDRAILGPAWLVEMTKPHPVSSGLRGLGWDIRTGYSTNRGQSFSDKAFGHGGFTGTALWIDPGHELFVIFLSNRLHPDGKGAVNTLAGRVGTIAGAAATARPAHP